MNRHERRAQRRSLPVGKRALPTLPPEVRSMVSDMADNVRGKPWFSAYAASQDLFRIFNESLVRTDKDIPVATFAAQQAIAALIECLGGDANKCDDPFQTYLYRNSARKDHQRASARYEAKAGGTDAVSAEMQKWVRDHKEETEELDAGVLIRGAEHEGNGPLTLEQLVTEWAEQAKA